jgi:capsule polysaccharide export protein KpsE/RkpR
MSIGPETQILRSPNPQPSTLIQATLSIRQLLPDSRPPQFDRQLPSKPDTPNLPTTTTTTTTTTPLPTPNNMSTQHLREHTDDGVDDVAVQRIMAFLAGAGETSTKHDYAEMREFVRLYNPSTDLLTFANRSNALIRFGNSTRGLAMYAKLVIRCETEIWSQLSEYYMNRTAKIKEEREAREEVSAAREEVERAEEAFNQASERLQTAEARLNALRHSTA